MKVLHVCSEDAVPMKNIVELYQKHVGPETEMDLRYEAEEVEEYDIVHGHYVLTRPVIRAYRRAKRKGIPFVAHSHGSDIRRITGEGPKKLPLHHSMISKYVRKRADLVLLSTPDLLDFAEGEYLPNPVDLELFRPMDVEKTDKILLLGRFVNGGGILDIIDEEKEYDCINWGDDIDFPDNVQMLDFVDHDELPELLNRYERMIGPLVDPVSLARLEAMACGLDTYTDFDEKYTKYYHGENPDKVDDPRAFVERFHNPEKIVEILLAHYKELI